MRSQIPTGLRLDGRVLVSGSSHYYVPFVTVTVRGWHYRCRTAVCVTLALGQQRACILPPCMYISSLQCSLAALGIEKASQHAAWYHTIGKPMV